MANNSRADDERSAQERKGRMDTTHGGQLVEAIAPDELESFNDANCKHENFVRDETETEFNAFLCSNPKCAEVLYFDRQ